MSTAYLPLRLKSPMQSWGVRSKFDHRDTHVVPTKSGVIGLVCAALGVPKGTRHPCMDLGMHVAQLAKNPQCLQDYHTVEKTLRMSGSPNPHAVITRRDYLHDSDFGALLFGEKAVLDEVAKALQDPVWGVWLGRKSAIPSEPIYTGGPFDTEAAAWKPLLGDRPLSSFYHVLEVADWKDGTDTLPDTPLNYQTREFSDRRVQVNLPQ